MSEAEQRSVLIIVNPTSGRGRGSRTGDNVAGILQTRGLKVTTRATRTAGDAERITRESSLAEGAAPGCVVGCGGDGTIQEVAHALASLKDTLGEACPLMGLAPAGRCNDFAHAVGIPTNPAAIADVLIRGQAVALDLGRVNGRHFCTVATMGVDAQVSSYVDTMKLPLRGTLAYVYAAVRVLSHYQPQPVRITGDFGTIEQPVFLASSANTSTYGGAIEIVPGADPTDGWLDLCIIDHVSRPRAWVLLPTVLTGCHRSAREVRFIRTKQFRIEADEKVELWADGERIAGTPATIDIVPQAVRVLLPAGDRLSERF